MNNQQVTKKFHLGDILSIIHKDSPLISPRHMDGIYDILGFMTNDKPFTNQLPRVHSEVIPYIQEAFPQLLEIDLKQITTSNWKVKLDGWVKQFGEYHEVRRIHPEDHQVLDPRIEFTMQRPDVEQIDFNMDEDGNLNVSSDDDNDS